MPAATALMISARSCCCRDLRRERRSALEVGGVEVVVSPACPTVPVEGLPPVGGGVYEPPPPPPPPPGDGGGVGGGVGGEAWVVAAAEELCGEVFPAASYAETVYEYAVEGLRPVSLYAVPTEVAT